MKINRDKIKNFFQNRYTLIFLIILAAAIAIRIYYFVLTLNQPLWWDEADYMMMARSIGEGISYKFDPVRPILFSLISGIGFKITGYNDFFPRFLMLIMSIAAVVYTYLLGKTIYNEKAGLIAASLMASIPLALFFTVRLLVDLPSLCFFTISAYYFYNYIKTKDKKQLYLAFIFTGIGSLFRLTTGAILLVILGYLLITEKLEFLKKKEYWIGFGLFILILLPYIIWGYIMFSDFVITKAGAVNAPTEPIKQGFEVLINYIKLMPAYLSWLGLIIFLLGITTLYKVFIGFDLIIKNKAPELNKDLFLILLLIIPLIVMSIAISHNEDRYIMNIFPAVLIMSGIALNKVDSLINKKYKIVFNISAIILIILIMGAHLKIADQMINSKKESYSQIKDAGIFLKENTPDESIIITSSPPQIALYSERKIIPMPGKKEDIDLIKQENREVYLMVSIIEKSPEYVYNYPQENNLEIVKVYFIDKENQQPIIIIYKVS